MFFILFKLPSPFCALAYLCLESYCCLALSPHHNYRAEPCRIQTDLVYMVDHNIPLLHIGIRSCCVFSCFFLLGYSSQECYLDCGLCVIIFLQEKNHFCFKFSAGVILTYRNIKDAPQKYAHFRLGQY